HAPAPAGPLHLLQPRRRRRHAARRLAPAEAVEDDLLGVLGQLVQQRPGQRRVARGAAPPADEQVVRPAAAAPQTASVAAAAPRAACSVTISAQAGRLLPSPRGRTVTRALTSRSGGPGSPTTRIVRAGWTAEIAGTCSLSRMDCSSAEQKITRLDMRARCTGWAPAPCRAFIWRTSSRSSSRRLTRYCVPPEVVSALTASSSAGRPARGRGRPGSGPR